MDQLKRQAMQYYGPDGPASGVMERMEHIVNNIFVEQPDDIYGHIVNYFGQFTKMPTVSKLVSKTLLDSQGQTALQTELYCLIKGEVKLVCVTSLPCPTAVNDPLKLNEKYLTESEREKSLEAAIQLVSGEISEKLSGINPSDQIEVDDILGDIMGRIKEEFVQMKAESEQVEIMESNVSVNMEKPSSKEQKESKSSPRADKTSPKGKAQPVKSPKIKPKVQAPLLLPPDAPAEVLVPGCSAIAAVSQTICLGSANLNGIPLYKHLAQIRFGQEQEKFRLPLPMVTILASGKNTHGKSNCIKEFMVVPSPTMPIKTAVKNVMNIYNHCVKTLSAKGAMGGLSNEWGALCPPLDRPEQGIDLLEDAMKQLGLTPGRDFNLALNCAGHEICDIEKGKYEVAVGQLKNPDELGKFWTDLLARYPSIIAIIDPMRKQESQQWMALCEAVSNRCFIIGDFVYLRPGLLKNEEVSPDFRASGITFRLEQMNSISDIMMCAEKMEELGHQIIIGSSSGDTTDTITVDLAVGTGARFIRIGGPCRGERIAKLNRLIEIENELELHDQLLPGEDHVFNIVKIHVPSAEELPPVEEQNKDRKPEGKDQPSSQKLLETENIKQSPSKS